MYPDTYSGVQKSIRGSYILQRLRSMDTDMYSGVVNSIQSRKWIQNPKWIQIQAPKSYMDPEL